VVAVRVLLTGSRNWTDAATIRAALAAVADAAIRANVPMVTVVHGACPNGADELADQWVRWYRGDTLVLAERHPANWSKFAKRAGIIRNEIMVSKGADLCLVFLRDNSPGTTHCAELAAEAGMAMRVFHYGEPGVTDFSRPVDPDEAP
jgi:YspA, cpYpsA-related SLOG family